MVQIRKAVQEDCEQILNLVKELAVYEKVPNEVTVSLEQFTTSGFGEQPVYWALVVGKPELEIAAKSKGRYRWVQT